MAIWKENLAVNQMSLGAFFHAPFHLKAANLEIKHNCSKVNCLLNSADLDEYCVGSAKF